MLDEAAKTFATLLEARLRLGTCSSEDCVRYTFFAALLQHGVGQERVVLEWVHPWLPDGRIDTVLLDDHLKPVVAVEFKYDRANPGGKNQPLPQKAGALFRDFVRLLRLDGDLSRYLIYVTDGELARYLSNPRNGLAELFTLDSGGAWHVTRRCFEGRSATFLNGMGEWPCDATIRCVLRRALSAEHHLRVYEVRPGVL